MPKIKVTIQENGIDREVEIEVPEGSASWPKPEEMQVLGKPHPRLEGPDKVTGKAKYTYDINLPGMLYGKILRSPHAHARIRSLDLSPAERMPGVKAVISFDKEVVRYYGEEIAAVAAETEAQAEDALEAIKVEYDPLPAVAREEDAMKEGAPQVYPDRPNYRPVTPSEEGDVDAVFARNDVVVVEAEYRTQVQTHCCLETHGVVAKWDDDNHLTVWASTQGTHTVRGELAGRFNLPGPNVRVITWHMGGGFGSKFGAGVEGVAAALLAQKAGRPVKLMLDRKEEQLAVGNRPSSIQRLKAAASREGKLLAYECRAYGTAGVSGGAGFPAPYIYVVPNRRVAQENVFIHAGGARAMRAPGHPQASFGMECLMDELAHKLGMDPIEFRKKNLGNSPIDNIRRRQFDLGAEAIGWNTRRNKVPGAGSGPIKRGIGVGCGTWGGGGGPGNQVTLRLHPDGSVELQSAIQDLGTGTRTAAAIVAAEELGIQPQQIKADIGDTRFGPATGSGGSTTLGSLIPAVKMAAANAKQQLFQRVAPLLGVKPEDLIARNGKILVKTDPNKGMTWKEACAKLGMDIIQAQGTWVPGLNTSGVAGVQFVEVEVDTETGRVRPIKVVAVQDCGLVVNPLTAESQIISGVIQGLSYALLENRILDRVTCRMVNANFEDYKVVGSFEVPEIVPILMNMPERGVIGLGEPPVIPTAGAVANAVFNAIGQRIRSLPITPDKVLSALGKVKEA